MLRMEKVLFINDIILCADYGLQLLSGGAADMVCGMVSAAFDHVAISEMIYTGLGFRYTYFEKHSLF